jgi:hypothetical protein
MFRSSVVRWVLGLLLLIAVLGVIKFKPWRLASRGAAFQEVEAREDLRVGFSAGHVTPDVPGH